MQPMSLRLRLVVTTSLVFLAGCARGGSSGAPLAGGSAAPTSPVQLATPSVPLLPGGGTSTLTDANKALSFSVLVADHEPASTDTLTTVLLDRTNESVALEYSGGDVDIVESPAAYRHADSYFEGIIKDGVQRKRSRPSKATRPSPSTGRRTPSIRTLLGLRSTSTA